MVHGGPAALEQAWALCRLLVVAAPVQVSGRGATPVEFGNGVHTGRGTFPTFFRPDELPAYLEGQLGTETVAAALGVFYLF